MNPSRLGTAVLIERHLLAAIHDLCIKGTDAEKEIIAALGLLGSMAPCRSKDNLKASLNEMTAAEGDEVAEWINANFFSADANPIHESPRETLNMTAKEKWKWAYRKIAVSGRVIRVFSSHLNSSKSSPEMSSLEVTKELMLKDDVMTSLQTLPMWDFDIFEFGDLVNGNIMPVLGLHIMRELRLLKSFNISETVFNSLMVAIQDNYLDTPYHNKFHGTDVMVSTYWLIAFQDPLVELSDLDKLSMLVASAMHDLRHPGTNNAFLINSDSDLALTYNDISVLENYHLVEFFKLLKDPKLNIFQRFRSHQYLEIRKKIISMVLSTDMSKHLVFSRDAQYHLSLLESTATQDQLEKKKQFFMDMIVHASDLSSPVKGLKTSIEWAHRIWEEFFRQGDKEKAMGVEISPMMSRDASAQTMSKSQKGFIDYVVYPLYELVAHVSPHVSIVLEHADENKIFWENESIKPDK